ncbi:hypothetical protein HRbin36_02828 [bacterium HR36]|nr:hypothetical protein HRbin36_02828 [bacterium HR36]
MLGVAELFWGHEMWRAQTTTCTRQVQVGVQVLDQTEIGQFSLAPTIHQDIVRLNVAVNNALLVCLMQALGHLHDISDRFLLRQTTLPFHTLPQRLSFHQLHHDVGHFAVPTKLQSPNNIRMSQSAGGTELLLKTLQQYRVVSHARREHFYRYQFPTLSMPPTIHRAHPTLGYEGEDLVRPNLFWQGSCTRHGSAAMQ